MFATASLYKLGYHLLTIHLVANSSSSKQWTIPVLSPLLNQKTNHMIIGANILLDPPTPLQWKTIEACVESHHHSSHDGQEQGNDSDNQHQVAVVDAAPLVAILDHHQQQPSTSNNQSTRSGGSFAMLAAVVGVSTQRRSSSSSTSTTIDTSDATSFRESLEVVSLNNKEALYSSESTVRLLCVGRAMLSNFFHRQEDDDEGPILMASMKIVLDDDCSAAPMRSNVHAISKMAAMANRISFLHQDRQRLVRGIQAANARLETVSQRWKDLDGLGKLYANDNAQQQQQQQQQQTEESTIQQPFMIEQLDQLRLGQSRPMSIAAIDLMNEENYGMGNTATSMSGLGQMTEIMLSQMKPFYSPDLLASEEFYYSVYSFVALCSLQSVLDRSQIRWSLQHCTDTLARFERIYDWVLIHKQLLQEIAEAKVQELADCGEECDII
jgi:hypothetical protein